MPDDDTFKVEIAFVSTMVGAGGEAILQEKVLQCLPSDAKVISESQCLASLKVLEASKLYTFVGAGAQGVARR